MTWKVLAALVTVTAAAAVAAEPQASRHLVILDRPPSLLEVRQTTKYGGHLLERAKAAGQELDLRVAHDGDLVLVNVRAPALCSVDKGCPLLVFRNLERRPALETVAFASVVVYRPPKRPNDVGIVTQSGAAFTDCTVPRQGRARCLPAR